MVDDAEIEIIEGIEQPMTIGPEYRDFLNLQFRVLGNLGP